MNKSLIFNNLEEVFEMIPLSIYKPIGKDWYWGARLKAQDMSNVYNKDLSICCAIISCLSPQKNWYHNIELAYEFFKNQGKYARHTSIQINKAKRIYKLNGIRSVDTQIATIDFELNGPKTINFFHNIYEPNNENYITIDSHMIQIMSGDMLKKTVTSKQYEVYKSELIKFAKHVGIHSVELQTLIWEYWRTNKKGYERINKVL